MTLSTHRSRTTRTRRNAEALDAEASYRIAQATRAAHAMTVAVEVEALWQMRGTPEFWQVLRALGNEQLVSAAIDMACYLETIGVNADWRTVLERWQRGLG